MIHLKKGLAIWRKREIEIVAPFILYPILALFVHCPHPLFNNSVFGTHWFFLGTSLRHLEKHMIIHVGNCNILKFFVGRFFPLPNCLGLLSPLLKNRWVYCFCFFPSIFFFFLSITTRNSANWWVYYCGIALFFGLGLYHHESNSNPTHTMQRAKSKGQWTIGPGFSNLEIFPILYFLFNKSSFGFPIFSK